jgi:hypothetical protein
MTPFCKVQRDASSSMIERAAMLAQPCEFFKAFFNGRIPTVAEKAFFVEEAVQRMTSVNIYQNDTYRVSVKNVPPFIHLDIRRRDGKTCTEWYDFQQIKNELIGPEHEALQLFPAESRLVDTGNEYHLWVCTDARERFQFGFKDRFVLGEAVQPQERPETMSPVSFDSGMP